MHPDARQSPAEAAPYLLAMLRRGRVEIQGQPSVEFGHRLPSRLPVADGVFAGWHWDGARLVVRNDRYGFFPLFWSRLPGDGICVSSSVVSLIEHGVPTKLDVDALSVFFRMGFFLGEDTPFAAVKVVPPNATFEWSDGRLLCRGRYPSMPAESTLSRDEAIDGYIDLFAKAMAKRAPTSDKFAVPISGGRDSRHILLELHRTGFTPAQCISVRQPPPSPNQDPLVARQLCERLGFKHVTFDQGLSLLAAQQRKDRETHFCAGLAHAWFPALADELNGRFDCTYDGIAGDILSQLDFFEPRLAAVFRTRDVRAVCTDLLSRGANSTLVLQKLLGGELRRAANPATAIARLTRELPRHFDAPNPISSFYFWNRTRRMIALAPYAMLRGIPNVYAPYLDHDLCDFLATLPIDMLVSRTFHTETIARAYPALAGAPYADHKHAPPIDNRSVRRQFYREATRRIVLRRPSLLMKTSGSRVRILAGLLSRGRVNPFVSPLIVYLDQLEEIVRGQR